MDLSKFSDRNTIVGFSKQPQLQKQVKNSKYYDIPIPKNTEKTLNLSDTDLIHILIRNSSGQTQFFTKEVKPRTGGLKFYLPRKIVKELEVEEDSMLDFFVSKD